MVQKLKKVSKALDKASKLHKQQSNIIRKYIKKTVKKSKPVIKQRKK